MEKVCVLMSLYNGEKYLRQQLESIFLQKNVEVLLIVRDDGSNDGTMDIIREYSEAYGHIEIPDALSGFHNDVGIGSSFYSLLRYAVNTHKDVDFFAFADQDDYWLDEKVWRGVNSLEKFRRDKALYFCKKEIVDQELNHITDDTFVFHNDFSDFLTPNQAYGCTMMITRTFAQLLLSGPVESFPQLHDIVALKLALCTNTTIISDDNAMIKYRQHTGNASGYQKITVLNKNVVKKVLSKRRHYLFKLAEDFLKYYDSELLPEMREKLKLVANYKRPDQALKLELYYLSTKRSLRENLRFLGMLIFRGI